MKVVYTRHAKGRMRWRGISKDEVEQVIGGPDRKEKIGADRFHYYRRTGKRNLRVTCVLEGEKRIIISVVDKSD